MFGLPDYKAINMPKAVLDCKVLIQCPSLMGLPRSPSPALVDLTNVSRTDYPVSAGVRRFDYTAPFGRIGLTL